MKENPGRFNISYDGASNTYNISCEFRKNNKGDSLGQAALGLCQVCPVGEEGLCTKLMPTHSPNRRNRAYTAFAKNLSQGWMTLLAPNRGKILYKNTSDGRIIESACTISSHISGI